MTPRNTHNINTRKSIGTPRHVNIVTTSTCCCSAFNGLRTHREVVDWASKPPLPENKPHRDQRLYATHILVKRTMLSQTQFTNLLVERSRVLYRDQQFSMEPVPITVAIHRRHPEGLKVSLKSARGINISEGNSEPGSNTALHQPLATHTHPCR